MTVSILFDGSQFIVAYSLFGQGETLCVDTFSTFEEALSFSSICFYRVKDVVIKP